MAKYKYPNTMPPSLRILLGPDLAGQIMPPLYPRFAPPKCTVLTSFQTPPKRPQIAPGKPRPRSLRAPPRPVKGAEPIAGMAFSAEARTARSDITHGVFSLVKLMRPNENRPAEGLGGFRDSSLKRSYFIRGHFATFVYNPTFPAALSVNSEPRRMYFRTMASDLCPVCAMMLRSLTPAAAAAVASPARKLWPA